MAAPAEDGHDSARLSTSAPNWAEATPRVGPSKIADLWGGQRSRGDRGNNDSAAGPGLFNATSRFRLAWNAL